jgi:glycosyltransferase involved in cell wall biosynthesis
MAQNVLIDLSKLKNRYNGLGQFSYALGAALLDAHNVEHAERRGGNQGVTNDFHLTYLLPKERRDLFQGPFSQGLCRFRDTEKSQKVSVPCFLRRLLDTDKTNYDIWHATAQDTRFWPCVSKRKASSKQRATKIIYTIHDLNYVHLYQGMKLRYKLSQIQKRIDQASVITTISHYVASEIRQYLTIGDKPLQVIYNGLITLDQVQAQKPALSTNRPFFLSLGELTPKKNFAVILPVLRDFPDFDWVVAGKKETPYGAELLQRVNQLGLSHRVHFLGVVEDAERRWLYENCHAFLFPSLAEGFGLPVIEAMSFGAPVFVSNRTSLPEVAGDRGFYWPDFSPDAMSQVLQNGLIEAKKDVSFAEKQRAHAKQFSWQKAAAAYRDLYRSLL